jgi:hypothetical protein
MTVDHLMRSSVRIVVRTLALLNWLAVTPHPDTDTVGSASGNRYAEVPLRRRYRSPHRAIRGERSWDVVKLRHPYPIFARSPCCIASSTQGAKCGRNPFETLERSRAPRLANPIPQHCSTNNRKRTGCLSFLLSFLQSPSGILVVLNESLRKAESLAQGFLTFPLGQSNKLEPRVRPTCASAPCNPDMR